MYGYIFWCKQLLTIKYVKTFQFTPESGIIPKLNDLCFPLEHKFKRIRSSLTKNGLLVVRDITLLFGLRQMTLSSPNKKLSKGHSFITFWNVTVNFSFYLQSLQCTFTYWSHFTEALNQKTSSHVKVIAI